METNTRKAEIILTTIFALIIVIQVCSNYVRDAKITTEAKAITAGPVLEQSGTLDYYRHQILSTQYNYTRGIVGGIILLFVLNLLLKPIIYDDITPSGYAILAVGGIVFFLLDATYRNICQEPREQSSINNYVNKLNTKEHIVEYILDKQSPTIKIDKYVNEKDYSITLGIPQKITPVSVNVAGNLGASVIITPTIQATFSPKEIKALNNEAKKQGIAEISVKETLANK